MIIAFKLAARRRKVAIAEVTGSISATSKGKVKAASIRLEAWSAADEADLRALLAPAKAACYVHDMLKPDLAVSVELVAHRLELSDQTADR